MRASPSVWVIIGNETLVSNVNWTKLTCHTLRPHDPCRASCHWQADCSTKSDSPDGATGRGSATTVGQKRKPSRYHDVITYTVFHDCLQGLRHCPYLTVCLFLLLASFPLFVSGKCGRLKGKENVFTARCTLVQGAVLRSHVVCLSVCDVGGLWSHTCRLEFFRNNFTVS